ncbi:MAG: FAD-binding protein [Actinomycetota bacterium]|nr:FAD-binding protein [Actinomycetota bacterium]
MKIVCLVKQIPRADEIEFDQETRSLKREGVPLILNPFDALAVTEAVRLRRPDDEVIAMAMGPPQAEEALRECLGLGADRCIHLSDRAFALADTIGTSRTLALALEKEGCDLVLCGRKTLDAETRQVPPEVAAFLGRPHATGSVGLELQGQRLHVRRETDEGEQTIELPLPAVVSVARAQREPAPTPREGRIDVWAATDLVDDLREDDKRFGQTGSPTRVLAVHDVTPERLGERVGSVEEAAARIRALAGERPAGATAWDKPPHLAKEPGRFYDCWTLVELVEGRPSRASLELLAKGRELSGKLGGANVALVLGHDVDAAVEAVSRHGAEVVHVAEDAALRDYVPEPWVAAVRSIVERERPHVLLIPATLRGRDLGPRVAGELQFGMTADCVDLGIDRGGRLVQHKPAYGGNIVSVIMGSTTPQLATVRPRMFEPLEPRAGDAEVRRIELPSLPQGPTRLLEERKSDPPPWRLDEAEIVAGLGPSVDLSALEEAAARADAAIGGDRKACAAGIVLWTAEIGIKGRAVAPRIYVAVEADPGFEHLTGAVKAGVIAAIAADERSPLLDAADVGLAGDWRELAPALLEALA